MGTTGGILYSAQAHIVRGRGTSIEHSPASSLVHPQMHRIFRRHKTSLSYHRAIDDLLDF
jgi:hypothetical protein